MSISEEPAQLVASNVMGTLRCGNPNCNHTLLQVHAMGPVFFRVLDCPSCHRGTEYENTTRGWTVRLLPARQATVAPRQRLSGAKT